MTTVKICGLTTLKDARQAWKSGASLLGFVFWPPSSRYVTPEQAASITRALTAEGCLCRYVGVFVREEIEAVREIANKCALHLVQLHGEESPEYASELGLPYIVARRVQDRVDWQELERYDAWAYLLDKYDGVLPGGTGRTWDWRLLTNSGDVPARVIVAGGLNPDNVTTVLEQAHPWGVDVSSGVEASPGRKDHARIASFMDQVRKVDMQR